MHGYFFDKAGDERMEKQNVYNWLALIQLIQNAALEKDPEGRSALPINKGKAWDILDIGCHTGGFLALFEQETDPSVINPAGVEPLFDAREKTEQRFLRGNFFHEIGQVPNQSADLVVSHETLYLVSDLTGWINELKRILRPDGGAFISLGSHGENTAWLRWRKQLEKKYGHISYPYQPMDILEVGENAGFDMELHRLHPKPQTSLRFSPPEDGWGEFLSAKEALDFQQQKYVFVFYPKR